MEIFTGPHKIKFILQDNTNWRRFVLKHPELMRPAVIENIQKIFDCRTEALGFHS